MRWLKKLRQKLKQAAFLPFDRSDRIPELSGRTVENDDAWAQAGQRGRSVPAELRASGRRGPAPALSYVKTDDGRPRH